MNVRLICIHFCTESKLYLICNKIVESIVHSISALLIQKEPWWWYLCAWMLKITTIYIRTLYSSRSKWLFIRKYGQCVLELYTRFNPIVMSLFCLHRHPINKPSNSNNHFVCISDISLTINFVANKKIRSNPNMPHIDIEFILKRKFFAFGNLIHIILEIYVGKLFLILFILLLALYLYVFSL